MLKGISFQVLRAEYENPFFSYSRLYLGIWIFLQNRVHGAFFHFPSRCKRKTYGRENVCYFFVLNCRGWNFSKMWVSLLSAKFSQSFLSH